MAQWLRLHASNAEGTGLIPAQGAKLPHAIQCGQNLKLKKNLQKGKKINNNKKKVFKVKEVNGRMMIHNVGRDSELEKRI